jgi:hypothetical protein
MDSTTTGESDAPLPELGLIDLLDVFVPGRIEGRVRITAREPLVCELMRDAAGRYFLAPEEDYRGGGMGSIPALNLGAEAKSRMIGRVVQVAGVFEDGRGVTVEAIALVGKPL